MVHLITICLLYLTTNNVNKIFAKGQYSQRSIHHSDQCTVGQTSWSIKIPDLTIYRLIVLCNEVAQS